MIAKSIYKVGVSKCHTNKNNLFSYRDVDFDDDGWADAKRFLPHDYDLMYLKLKDKGVISGWVAYEEWQGLRLKSNDEVLYWKRQSEETS